MIRIPEEWATSFRDLDIGFDATFDIFVNPDTKEWRVIYNQSRVEAIPVRFVFVVPADKLYVGAVPFHANLTDQAREDYGSKQRGKINGIVDPAKKEYAIQSYARISPHILEAFQNTIFYERVLSSYTRVNDIDVMAGEIN